MILVDLHQIAISNLVMSAKKHGGPAGPDVPINVDFLRHMILNSLRGHRKKFKAKFGELIIASDHRETWRRRVFPYYKHKRRKNKDEKSLFNWGEVYSMIDTIRDEIKEVFPYRVVMVPGAEADDVIATICQQFGNEDMNFGEQILVLSKDGDFCQLQKYCNVSQFDPIGKKDVKCLDPAGYLLEHIIRGDTGDGIPSILSDDDHFTHQGRRQSPITVGKLELLKTQAAVGFPDQKLARNFARNKMLIDLSQIPGDVKKLVMDEYAAQGGKNRTKLFSYFMSKGLKSLMEDLNDF